MTGTHRLCLVAALPRPARRHQQRRARTLAAGIAQGELRSPRAPPIAQWKSHEPTEQEIGLMNRTTLRQTGMNSRSTAARRGSG